MTTEPAPRRPAPWRRPAAQTAAVALLAALCYLNTLRNGFVLDDLYAVVDNRVVMGPLDLGRVFSTDFWGVAAGDPRAVLRAVNYRPLTVLTFVLDARLGGGAPWVFHLTNLLLHAVATGCFAHVLRARLGGGWAALAAAALFAVHPLHTEAVASIVGRADVLGFLAVGAVWWLHPRPGARATALAAAAFFAGLLAKEATAVALPLVVLADLAGPAVPRRTRAARYAAYALALVAFVALRWRASGVAVVTSPLAANNLLVGAPPGVRAATALRLFALGLELLVAPLNLMPDYGPSVIVPSAAVTGRVVAGAVALAALAAALAVAVARRRRDLADALAWLAVPGLLACNAVVLLPVIFAERWWYVPSAGACALFGLGLRWLEARGSPRLAAGLALGLVLAFVPLTVARNAVWHDNVTLFADAVATEPASALMRWGLGTELYARGYFREALPHCEAAARFAPRWADAHGCHAVMLDRLGRPREAARAFATMRAVGGASAGVWVGLVDFLIRHGRYDDAASELAAMRRAGRWNADADIAARRLAERRARRP